MSVCRTRRIANSSRAIAGDLLPDSLKLFDRAKARHDESVGSEDTVQEQRSGCCEMEDTSAALQRAGLLHCRYAHDHDLSGVKRQHPKHNAVCMLLL